MLIDITTASQLVGRHERIIRGWILSGKLDVHPLPFQVSADELLKVEHITEEDAQRIREYVETYAPKDDAKTDQWKPTIYRDNEGVYWAIDPATEYNKSCMPDIAYAGLPCGVNMSNIVMYYSQSDIDAMEPMALISQAEHDRLEIELDRALNAIAAFMSAHCMTDGTAQVRAMNTMARILQRHSHTEQERHAQEMADTQEP